MENVVQYLKDELRFSVHLESVPREQLKKMPMFMEHEYDYYLLDLDNHPLVLAQYNHELERNYAQLKKHAELISGCFDSMVVAFVFDSVDSYLRGKLIQWKINFIVPGKQVYLPDMLISLKESIRKMRTFQGFLTPSAQLLLLYHLQVELLENRSFKDIAGVLKYSTKTITQVAGELSARGLCLIEGSKVKQLRFSENKRMLWEKSLPMMQSPINKVFYLDHRIKNLDYPVSHDLALSHYTNLIDTDHIAYAVTKNEFQLLKSTYKNDIITGTGTLCFEEWKYDPRILSILSNNDYIDPLSLYLCFKDDPNERVQGELHNLIDNVRWFLNK